MSGAAIRGRTLNAGTGTWTNNPTRFGYQWLRCDGADCREIAGATAAAYVLTAADKGFAVTVVVTAANAWGSGVRAGRADRPGRRRAAGQHQRAR